MVCGLRRREKREADGGGTVVSPCILIALHVNMQYYSTRLGFSVYLFNTRWIVCNAEHNRSRNSK